MEISHHYYSENFETGIFEYACTKFQGTGMDVLQWHCSSLQDAAAYEGAFTPLIPVDAVENVSLRWLKVL